MAISNGGGDENAGMTDTRDSSSGLPDTNGPINGMSNPPIWLKKLSGGPLIRSTDRLIGSCAFQSDNVLRASTSVAPEGNWRWFSPGAPGPESSVIVNVPSGATIRSLPLRFAAVAPFRPVSTLKLVSAGTSPVKRPVITYDDALLTGMNR